MRNIYYVLLIAGYFAMLPVSINIAQVMDNFDSYTAGQRLACQDSILWTTWNFDPCNSTEDALVSDKFSFSAPNSFVITQNNDLVKLLGNQTKGIWYLDMNIYIPAGRHGYFNILSDFKPIGSSYYALECIFSLIKPGQIRLLANHTETNFPFRYDSWNHIQVIINLDTKDSEFWANDSLVLSWQWTQGSSDHSGPAAIDVIDFFGLTENDEMYVDDFWFHSSPVNVETDTNTDTDLSFKLDQNYPNPFNPSTMIKFSLPSDEFVSLTIFDLLGRKVETIIHEEKSAGSYEVNWKAENLSGGVYYYQLKSDNFIKTKKMLLLK